jgi:alkylation response protein AidB-like acyl-CoA dehydrogenase
MLPSLNDADRPFGSPDDIALTRDAARGFLATHWPDRHAVEMAERPEEVAKIWSGIARQGWTELGGDHDDGALSLAVVLMQELGRAACPAPLMDCFLANLALPVTSSGAASDFIKGLRDGTRSAAWIIGNPEAGEDSSDLALTTHEDELSLTGNVSFVENASSVTDFIVVTSWQIAIVPRHAPGLRIRATPGLSSPALADIHFDRVRPLCIQTSPIDLERLPVIARLLLAARAFGAAQRGFEILTGYAHVRSQFGKKIGSYQAIQHKLANLLIVMEICRLALLRAGAAGVSDIMADGYAASVAVATAARGLRDALLDIHHGFGGVSFWEDHEMPRHFRRVHGDLVRYGGLHQARCEIADALLGPL